MEAIQPADVGNGGGHGTVEPAAEPDDLCLIRRYTEHGDREAMGVLFDRHKDVAYRTAWRFMRSAAEAEDAVQTAFVKIMARTPSVIRSLTARGWILAVVANTCRDIIRSNQRRRCREKTAEEQREPMQTQGRDAGAELASMLKRMLDQIPDRYRLPVWLHHGEGLPFGEVSAALSVPEATLRSQTKRGLEMLRTRLAQAGSSLPMTSVLAVFPQVPMENAPSSLAASIPDIVRGVGEFSQAALGAQAAPAAEAGAVGGGRLTIGLKTAIATGVMLTAGAVGTAVYMMMPADTQGKAGATPPSAGQASYGWNFNSAEVPAVFKPTLGTWRHVRGGGPDGSGCMELEKEKSEIVIEVPVERLPVLVSYRHAIVPPVLEEGHMIRPYWAEYLELAQFFGLADIPGEPKPTSVGRWRQSKAYVTAEWIDDWADGYHASFAMIRRKPGSPLALFARGGYRLDDLRIDPIDPRELPDVSMYVAAVNRIPVDKRVGTVLLPEMKPGRQYKEVNVAFDRRPE